MSPRKKEDIKDYITFLNHYLENTPPELRPVVARIEKEKIDTLLKHEEYRYLPQKLRFVSLYQRRQQPIHTKGNRYSLYQDEELENQHLSSILIAQETRLLRLIGEFILDEYDVTKGSSEQEIIRHCQTKKGELFNQLYLYYFYSTLNRELTHYTDTDGEVNKEFTAINIIDIQEKAYQQFLEGILEEALVQMELALLTERLAHLEARVVLADRSGYIKRDFVTRQSNLVPERNALRQILQDNNLAKPLLKLIKDDLFATLRSQYSPSAGGIIHKPVILSDIIRKRIDGFIDEHGDKVFKEVVGLAQDLRESDLGVEIHPPTVKNYFEPGTKHDLSSGHSPYTQASDFIVDLFLRIEAEKDRFFDLHAGILEDAHKKSTSLTRLLVIAERYGEALDEEDAQYGCRKRQNKIAREDALSTFITLARRERTLTPIVRKSLSQCLIQIEANAPTFWEYSFLQQLKHLLVTIGSLIGQCCCFFSKPQKEPHDVKEEPFVPHCRAIIDDEQNLDLSTHEPSEIMFTPKPYAPTTLVSS